MIVTITMVIALLFAAMSVTKEQNAYERQLRNAEHTVVQLHDALEVERDAPWYTRLTEW